MTSSPGDLSNGFSLNKQITIIIMNKQYYIGLNVHKETIAIAYTHAHSRSKPTFYKTCSGSNLSCERNLRKLAKELDLKIQDLKVCYDAGPTGFKLARLELTLE